ncbi:MAG TPA: trypsin-like serine protease [Actinocrinis sp.]|uniref:trypsin-like serine peptidase n=1 Tax=Actinocrinis sp. TaxID=1920516 RepID=UPI002DDD7C8A|nr:trypsin-like serine protease [Actinocrinis sp.]HEV2346141.1 trypsin-like serine protease [Actinocrinis sp.]
MRVTGPDTQRHRQRRRRLAAAVSCLGTLAVAAIGTFVVEQRAVGAQSASNALAATAPGPQSLASQPVAYRLGPDGGLTPQQARPRPTSSGTAVAPVGTGTGTGIVTDGSTAHTPSPSAIGSAVGADGANGAYGANSADGADGTAPPPAGPVSPTDSAPAMTASNPLTATTFAGLPQVGAIVDYSSGTTGSHFCTGSVVSSQSGDIVITAAHCVYDTSSGAYVSSIAFVPGYHDGQQPYGIWTPTRILVPQQWINSGDPDYDVAFLVVHQPGSAQRIQDQVGANQLGLSPSYTGMVQVVGYPSTTDKPVTCTNDTKQFSPTQLEFDCPGFPDGTSGGPFMADVDPQSGSGTVVGVIGGYETGGDTPDISYSMYFGNAVADLFSQAEAAG